MRFLNRTRKSKITLAVLLPALAIATAAAVGLTATAAAQPARPATTAAHHATHAAAGDVSAGVAATTATLIGRHHLSRTQQIAWRMVVRFGWSARHQFRYLRRLWNAESGWRVHAMNPYSGAYGIPQALPGSKMASAGPNWRNSARTQIRWGLRYIRARYGSPELAWQHEQGYGWY